MASARNRSCRKSSFSQEQSRASRSSSAQPRRLISTTGEAFADGAQIDLLRDPDNPGGLDLILWRDGRATTGRVLKYQNQVYEPAPIDATILRAMNFPTRIAPYGSARDLLHGMAQELSRYSALPERLVTEVSWFSLATWLSGATESAPSLCILGSDTIEGNQLFTLLAAFCRRPLALSASKFGGVCSLPAGLQPTLLIRDPHFDRDVQRLLSAAHAAGEYVLRGGRLVDLHGPVVTLSEFGATRVPDWTVLRISVIQGRSPVPKLEAGTFEKIRDHFQPRLLDYRLANYAKVRHSRFDAPMLTGPVRELACCLGACTPEDGELQAEVVRILQQRNIEYLSAKSTDFKTTVVASCLFYSHHRPGAPVYIGEVAESVQTILVGGGESIKVTPRRVGEVIDALGLETEPRNKKGYCVLLTQAVCRRIHELARQMGLLPFADGIERCTLCRSDAPGDGPAGAPKSQAGVGDARGEHP
jgi:hypothetical protein